MSGSGSNAPGPDPEGFLPKAADRARRVLAEMDLYRGELERPSRLVPDGTMAEGRQVVDRVRAALRDLLAALDKDAAPGEGGGGGEPIRGRAKDE